MVQRVTSLGEIGVAGQGVLRPFDLTLQRAGAAWNLTGYTDPTIIIWDLRTRTALATPGTVTIEDAAAGTVRWTPGATVKTLSGTFEARIYATPSGGGDPEPSGLFRYTIAAGAQ